MPDRTDRTGWAGIPSAAGARDTPAVTPAGAAMIRGGGSTIRMTSTVPGWAGIGTPTTADGTTTTGTTITGTMITAMEDGDLGSISPSAWGGIITVAPCTSIRGGGIRVTWPAGVRSGCTTRVGGTGMIRGMCILATRRWHTWSRLGVRFTTLRPTGPTRGPPTRKQETGTPTPGVQPEQGVLVQPPEVEGPRWADPAWLSPEPVGSEAQTLGPPTVGPV